MFSWITGPRITNVAEDLGEVPNYDTTYIEPPETPAHLFAARAFRHALFGTPAPPANDTIKTEKQLNVDTDAASKTVLPARPENAPQGSPTKQPGGILMTPGTASKFKKTVTFGAHVKDNEGKRGTQIGRSGIPNDCPGKFPSPWTPGTQLLEDNSKSTKPRTKLTEALYEARSTTPAAARPSNAPVSKSSDQPTSRPGDRMSTVSKHPPRAELKPHAKDDMDLTINMSEPRSDSGKFWKEQYETYKENTEKEMKQLLQKKRLAKTYAKQKDGEAMELATKLQEERKRFRQREKALEQQNKDLQERLRQVSAENAGILITVATLKKQVATLVAAAGSANAVDAPNSKASFEIFEDLSDDSILDVEQEKPTTKRRPSRADDPLALPSTMLAKPVQPARNTLPGKENSPPKPSSRRSVLPQRTPRTLDSQSNIPPRSRTHSRSRSILTDRPGREPHVQPQPRPRSRSHSPSRADFRPDSPSHSHYHSLMDKEVTDAAVEASIPYKPAFPDTGRAPPAGNSYLSFKVHSPCPLSSTENMASHPTTTQDNSDIWALSVDSSPFPEQDRMALPITSGPSYGGGLSYTKSIPTRPKHSRTQSLKPATHLKKDRPAISHAQSSGEINKPSISDDPLEARFQKLSSASGIDKPDPADSSKLQADRLAGRLLHKLNTADHSTLHSHSLVHSHQRFVDDPERKNKAKARLAARKKGKK